MPRRSSRIREVRRRPASPASDAPPSRRRRREPDNKASHAADIQAQGSALAIESVDLHPEENRSNHRTNEYEQQDLIVRRGQEFKVSITFEQDYDAGRHEIILVFRTGNHLQESKGTLIRVSTKPSAWEDDWTVPVVTSQGRKVTLSVLPSADAIVGKYGFSVETLVDGKERAKKNFNQSFYVLFNAWCKDDVVYMEDEKERAEYVLNEKGGIWVGSKEQFSARPWEFGQFEDVCLEAALYLLEDAKLPVEVWGNPVKVLRTLSAKSNSMDGDNGVLEGNWSGDYDGGKKPWSWTGSVAILDQFMKTRKTVKFGQCWVFSGIITTLCRAVGIPTRSVTNFESAHDCDESMTIDVYWKDEDTYDEDATDDSKWNFHVWNESWLRRPDLPKYDITYDGWQAHDATPQEASEGVYRCGPAPLNAIKEGHVWLNYDVPFVFAEVNGDRLHWMPQKEDGRLACIYVDAKTVGKFISTKAPGAGRERLDVTDLYKYPDGSAKERLVNKSVFRFGNKWRNSRINAYQLDKMDVKFEEHITSTTKYGEDVQLRIKMTNKNDSESRTVRLKMNANAILYTGELMARLGNWSKEITIGPGKSETYVETIKADDYMDQLKKADSVKVYVNAFVKETLQRFIHSENIAFETTNIVLEAPERVKIKDDFTLKIKYTNNLKRPIKDGVFSVDGVGIVRGLEIQLDKPVNPGETVEREVSLNPYRLGDRDIVVTLESDVAGKDIVNSIDVQVYK